MKLKTLALAIAAVPVAFTLTGCFSSDDDDDSSSTTNAIYVNAEDSSGGGDTKPNIQLYKVTNSSYKQSTALSKDDLEDTSNTGISSNSELTNLAPTAGSGLGNGGLYISVSDSADVGSEEKATVTFFEFKSGDLESPVFESGVDDGEFAGVEQSAVGFSKKDNSSKLYVAFTTGEEDGGVIGIANRFGKSSDFSPSTVALDTSNSPVVNPVGSSDPTAFDDIAVDQTSANNKPTFYVTAENTTSTTDDPTSDDPLGTVLQCPISFNSDNEPSLNGVCLEKTNLNNNIDGNGRVMSDVQVTSDADHVLIVQQVLNSNEDITSSNIVNCPTSNWTADNQCSLLSVDFPSDVSGQFFGDIDMNGDRTQVVINIVSYDLISGPNLDMSAVICDVNKDGTEITNCVLPENSDDDVIDIKADDYTAI